MDGVAAAAGGQNLQGWFGDIETAHAVLPPMSNETHTPGPRLRVEIENQLHDLWATVRPALVARGLDENDLAAIFRVVAECLVDLHRRLTVLATAQKWQHHATIEDRVVRAMFLTAVVREAAVATAYEPSSYAERIRLGVFADEMAIVFMSEVQHLALVVKWAEMVGGRVVWLHATSGRIGGAALRDVAGGPGSTRVRLALRCSPEAFRNVVTQTRTEREYLVGQVAAEITAALFYVTLSRLVANDTTRVRAIGPLALAGEIRRLALEELAHALLFCRMAAASE